MIILWALLLMRGSMYSQNNINCMGKQKITYDVDTMPVFSIYSHDNKVNFDYYFVSKDSVSIDIQYDGGYKSLSAYCDSLYFCREDYDYTELNARAYYTILFDHDLNLKEIKIIKRLGYDNLEYNYDELIKRILFSTEGRWMKRNNKDNSKWYFYYGSFNVR
jgi:hypothetical protein